MALAGLTPLYGGYFVNERGDYGVMIDGKFVASTPEADRWLSAVDAQKNAGPTADSAYLTALRSLGYDKATAYRIAARNVAQVNRQMGLAEDDVKASGDISRRNISGNAEVRGIYRSGEHLRNLSEQRASEGRRLGSIQSIGAGQIGGYQNSLEQSLSDISRQRAEQEMALSLRREQKAILDQYK